MRLLWAHRILVLFSIVLAAVLVVWAIRHSHSEAIDSARYIMVGGVTFMIAGTVYLIKLFRRPPVH